MLWRRRDLNQNKLVSVWSPSGQREARKEGRVLNLERVSAVSIPFRHARARATDAAVAAADDVCERDRLNEEGVKFCGSLLRPHSSLPSSPRR